MALEDGSGYLSAGEFGRFMRKGEEGVGSVSTTWRQNLHAKLQSEREEFEAVLYKEARRNAHIEPAEESEVNEMAVKLTKKMHQVFVAQNPSWYEETRLGQGTSHCSPKPLIPLLPLTGTSCSVTWTTTAAARSHTPSSPTSSVTSFSSTSGSALDLRLRGVWRALDADGSGYLTAGEFGHFMRRAEAQPESSGAYGVDVGWRTKLHKKRRQEKESFVMEMNKESFAFADVKGASESEVRGLAQKMHRKMCELFQGQSGASWYTLFRHMDDDGSGKITCDSRIRGWFGSMRFARSIPSPPTPFPATGTTSLPTSSATSSTSRIRTCRRPTCGREIDRRRRRLHHRREFGQFMRKGEVLPPRETLVERRRAASARVRRSIEETARALLSRRAQLQVDCQERDGGAAAPAAARGPPATQRVVEVDVVDDRPQPERHEPVGALSAVPAGRPNTSQSARH